MKLLFLILIIVLGVNAQTDDDNDDDLKLFFEEVFENHENEMKCVKEKMSNRTTEAKLSVISRNFHYFPINYLNFFYDSET